MENNTTKYIFNNQRINTDFNGYDETLKTIAKKLGNGTLSFEEYILNEYSTVDRFSKVIVLCDDKERLCDTFIAYFRNEYSFVSISRLKTLFNQQSIKLLGEKMNETVRSITTEKAKVVEFASIWAKISQRFENDFRVNSRIRIQKNGDIEYTDELVDKVLKYMKRNDIYLCEPHVEYLLDKISRGQIDGDAIYLKPAREEELIKPVVKKIERSL